MSSPPSNSGIKFGNFAVVARPDGSPDLLGGGSYGKTYKATHSYLGTISALKVIHDSYAMDASVKKRFLAEARAIAKLKHPNIAQIVDCGEEDGTLYYAMEFCDGGDLERRMSHGPMQEREALHLIRQTADALAYVHEQGFLHRDIKPSNIMLASPEGAEGDRTKLIDFGLVKQFSHQNAVGVTQTGQFLGTMLFSSPEQLREEKLDPRSDIYSLGLTLWCLIHGGIPFPGKPAQVMAHRLGGKGYGDLFPKHLSPRTRDLLSEMLADDPKARIPDMASVVHAIDACLEVGEAPNAPLLQLSAAVASSLAKPMSQTDRDLVRLTTTPALASEKYDIATEGVAVELGQRHRGTRKGTGGTVAITFVRRSLAGDQRVVNALEQTVIKASTCEGRFLLRPIELVWCRDHLMLVEEWVDGLNLLALLRHRKLLSLKEASPLLRQLAEAADMANQAGLPNLELAAHSLTVQFSPAALQSIGGRPDGFLSEPIARWPKFLLRLAPSYVREDKTSSSTPQTQARPLTVVDNDGGDADIVARFSKLVYRTIGGHQVPATARISRQAYLRIPGLTEEGNALLRDALIGESACESCVALLERLWRVEAVPTSHLLVPEETEMAAIAAPPKFRNHSATESPTTHAEIPIQQTETAFPPILTADDSSGESTSTAPDPAAQQPPRERPANQPLPAAAATVAPAPQAPTWQDILGEQTRPTATGPRPPIISRPAIQIENATRPLPLLPIAIILGLFLLTGAAIILREMMSTATEKDGARAKGKRDSISQASSKSSNAPQNAIAPKAQRLPEESKASAASPALNAAEVAKKLSSAPIADKPALLRELTSLWKKERASDPNLPLTVCETYSQHALALTPDGLLALRETTSSLRPDQRQRLIALVSALETQLSFQSPSVADPIRADTSRQLAEIARFCSPVEPTLGLKLADLFQKNALTKESIRCRRESAVALASNANTRMEAARQFQHLAEQFALEAEGRESIDWLSTNLVAALPSDGQFGKVVDPFETDQLIDIPASQWKAGGKVAMPESKKWFRLPERLPPAKAKLLGDTVINPFDHKPVSLPPNEWRKWAPGAAIKDDAGREFILPVGLPPLVGAVAREACDAAELNVRSPFTHAILPVSPASWKSGAKFSEKVPDAASVALQVMLPDDLPAPNLRASLPDGEQHSVKSPYGGHRVRINDKASWQAGAKVTDSVYPHLKLVMPSSLPEWIESEAPKPAVVIKGEYAKVRSPYDGSEINVDGTDWKRGSVKDRATGKTIVLPQLADPKKTATIKNSSSRTVINPYTFEEEAWKGEWKSGESAHWGGSQFTYRLPTGIPAETPVAPATTMPQQAPPATAEFVSYTAVKYEGRVISVGADDWTAGSVKSRGTTVRLPPVGNRTLTAEVDDAKKKQVKNPFTGKKFTWEGDFTPGTRKAWGPFTMALGDFKAEPVPEPKPVKVVMENTIPQEMRRTFGTANGVRMKYSKEEGGYWISEKNGFFSSGKVMKASPDMNDTCRTMTETERRAGRIPQNYRFVPVEGNRVKAIRE